MAKMPNKRLTTPDPEGAHGQVPNKGMGRSKAPKGAGLTDSSAGAGATHGYRGSPRGPKMGRKGC